MTKKTGNSLETLQTVLHCFTNFWFLNVAVSDLQRSQNRKSLFQSPSNVRGDYSHKVPRANVVQTKGLYSHQKPVMSLVKVLLLNAIS